MRINKLEPEIIWQHFDAINAIPRASTKEEEISAFIVAFGKSLNLITSIDQIGNVLIRKPATKGKERCKTVVLQGHLDMVHQKEEFSNFNFETQGIQMHIDGDWVKARETTLGADNGIGVAAIMAVLSSKNLIHPPIEALFTIDEEMGMTGAMALTKNQLKGELLLNLDSEEDDEITIGCAGGVDVKIEGTYETKILDAKEYILYEINLSNLTGGHSGVDIHLNTANVILLLAEYLNHLTFQLDCRLHSIHAGTLTNVIPRNGKAIIAVREDKIDLFESEAKIIGKRIQRDCQLTDPNLNVEIKKVSNALGVLNIDIQNKILSALLKTPNGVHTWTDGIPDLVQTSNNISIINIAAGSYEIICHTRSSVDIERNQLAKKIKNCFYFAKVTEIGPYPGWEPKPNSNLLAIAKDCYQKLNGALPNVKSIHAGLECGVISGIYPTMEMISFGPNILGAHSPQERLQISSTQKFWKFLTQLLSKLE